MNQTASSNVTSNNTPDLKELADRVAFLTRRKDELGLELEKGKVVERELAAHVAAGEIDLAEGRIGTAALATRVRKLSDHRATQASLGAAFSRVELELHREAAVLSREQTARERQRQTAASAELRAAVEAKVDEFVSLVRSAVRHLLDRGRLVEEIAKEFPLAPVPEPVTISGIADKLREEWPRWQEDKETAQREAAPAYRDRFEWLVLKLLAGPTTSDPRLRVQQHFGIR